MRILAMALTAATLLSPKRAAPKVESGEIRVTFKFQGKPPKNKFETMTCKYCQDRHPDGLEREDVVVKDDRIRDVFVHISQGLAESKFDPPAEEFVVHQEGCRYRPHVFGVMRNQSVAFVNDDDTAHNVNKAPGINPGFNFGHDKKGRRDTVKFPNEEFMVSIGCSIHGWMNCHMNVVSHPYFAVSGDDGVAVISNVPSGRYTIEFLHPSSRIQPDQKTADVAVESGKKVEVTVTYGRK